MSTTWPSNVITLSRKTFRFHQSWSGKSSTVQGSAAKQIWSWQSFALLMLICVMETSKVQSGSKATRSKFGNVYVNTIFLKISHFLDTDILTVWLCCRFLMNLSLIDDERVLNAANPSRQNEDMVPIWSGILYQFQEILAWFPMSQHRRRWQDAEDCLQVARFTRPLSRSSLLIASPIWLEVISGTSLRTLRSLYSGILLSTFPR